MASLSVLTMGVGSVAGAVGVSSSLLVAWSTGSLGGLGMRASVGLGALDRAGKEKEVVDVIMGMLNGTVLVAGVGGGHLTGNGATGSVMLNSTVNGAIMSGKWGDLTEEQRDELGRILQAILSNRTDVLALGNGRNAGHSIQ